MNPAVITVIVVSSVLVYWFIGTLVFYFLRAWAQRAAERAAEAKVRIYRYRADDPISWHDDAGHELGVWFGSFFWPLVVPVTLIVALVVVIHLGMDFCARSVHGLLSGG